MRELRTSPRGDGRRSPTPSGTEDEKLEECSNSKEPDSEKKATSPGPSEA